MTKKIVNSVKYVGLFSLVLLSVIACERDFENIGVGLVDNNEFATKVADFEVIAYNKNDTLSRVDGIPEYLLGILKDENFGYIKTSFISQLGLPTSTDFGDNVSIDAVILDIPYYATKEENLSDGKPNFKLDSILGNQETEYKLSVYETGTFLNTLEPLDPTKNKKYYSNEVYDEKTLLYHSDEFYPNRNDTVLYVKRRFLDDDSITVDDTDTIKAENSVPSIKMSLDTVFFRNNFVNQQNSGAFDSRDNFIDFFRGIIIKAEENIDKDGSLMALAMSNANVSIYYTNTILTDETDTDLNNDGDTDDKDVPVRTKQTMIFPLSGLRTNQYNRDYSESLVNINERFVSPDLINGEDKLYIQGAAGSMGIVDLLIPDDDLNKMRDENWLINEANLTMYLDSSFTQEKAPDQLLLYNYDNNSQILDVITEGQVGGIGGILERNEDNKPIKYKFRITDYISEFLKSDDEKPVRFGLKVFHSTDVPLVLADTIIDDFSWIAKGVVLNGNTFTGDKKLKLEIFYTINND